MLHFTRPKSLIYYLKSNLTRKNVMFLFRNKVVNLQKINFYIKKKCDVHLNLDHNGSKINKYLGKNLDKIEKTFKILRCYVSLQFTRISVYIYTTKSHNFTRKHAFLKAKCFSYEIFQQKQSNMICLTYGTHNSEN